MKQNIVYLSLLITLPLIGAPQQPPQQPTKEPAAAQPAPKNSMLEPAAWSCERDYEHYIQCLREYADSLKDDMSKLGRQEYKRVQADLALAAGYKQKAREVEEASASTPAALVPQGASGTSTPQRLAVAPAAQTKSVQQERQIEVRMMPVCIDFDSCQSIMRVSQQPLPETIEQVPLTRELKKKIAVVVAGAFGELQANKGNALFDGKHILLQGKLDDGAEVIVKGSLDSFFISIEAICIKQ